MNGSSQDKELLEAKSESRLRFLEGTLESGRYLVLIAVFATFVASIATFIWGAYQTYQSVVVIVDAISHGSEHTAAGIKMIAILDAFLLATILYIFAVALYELFIDDLDVPAWLTIHNLDDLKLKLISVIVLIMAVTFLEHLAEWENAMETLLFGLSISAILIGLVLYLAYGAKRSRPGEGKDQDGGH